MTKFFGELCDSPSLEYVGCGVGWALLLFGIFAVGRRSRALVFCYPIPYDVDAAWTYLIPVPFHRIRLCLLRLHHASPTVNLVSTPSSVNAFGVQTVSITSLLFFESKISGGCP